MLTLSTLRQPLLFALLYLTLLSVLAGCGTQTQNAIKVQDILSEAARHAQVDPDDTQARVWADRAIAVAPSAIETYVGQPGSGPDGPLYSIADIFGDSGIGDNAALADYMQQAAARFPEDYRPLLFLTQAQDRLGGEAARRATAAKLAALLTKKLAAPGAQDIENLTLTRAQAYWDAGDPVNGAAEYQRAIRAYPSDPGPPNNLAYAYAVTNTHLPEALKLSQQAMALAQKKQDDEQTVATYQDTLGWVQYRLGEFKQAEQNLQEAASAFPRQPELRYHLGMVYAAEGKTNAARAEFGHALLLSKDYAAAKQALAAVTH